MAAVTAAISRCGVRVRTTRGTAFASLARWTVTACSWWSASPMLWRKKDQSDRSFPGHCGVPQLSRRAQYRGISLTGKIAVINHI